MNAVWASSSHGGTARLVLLAIADRADDNGYAWPSARELGERAGVTQRQAQRIISQLVASGELEIAEPGGGRARSNHYRVTVRNYDIRAVENVSETTTSASGLAEEETTTLVSQTTTLVSRNYDMGVVRTIKNRQEPSEELARRARDPAFEFVVEVSGEPLPNHRKGYGKIAADLRALLASSLNGDADNAEACLAELRRRHEALIGEFGEAKATARALVGNWHRAGKMADGLMRPPNRASPLGIADRLIAHANQLPRENPHGTERR